jgi:tRNA modification GTPase
VRSIIEKVNFIDQKLVFLLNKTDISCDNNNVNVHNLVVSLLKDKKITATTPIIPISAKVRTGIHDLRAFLSNSQRNLITDSDTTLVTNQRHIQALTDARTSLQRVRNGLAAGLPTDLAAQDIREAIYHLGSIVGEISTDEVLGNIFRNFCIGK